MYTMSNDGIERETIAIKIRLTQDESEKFSVHAKRRGLTLREWVTEQVNSVDLHWAVKEEEKFLF